MSTGEPAPAPPPVPLWNIANILTITRLVMVPLFVVFMFLEHPAWRFAAFAVFVVAAITDRVDGEIARRRNLVTDFGKIADPIADKALTGAALVVLSLLGELWWWVTIAILVREWGVTALRFAVIRHGVIPASRGGKLKTVLQVVAISVYLFPLPEPLTVVAHVVMAAALVVTLWTGGDYVVQALRLRRRDHTPGPAA
ncbi:CDP-diacylglycerol--glycerol-3-phosphate 3-phosphatidyltransferase [Streptomonospora nanhaiensis]|uniref:CDP-diacylglycerol--glycerol-3-phosphate 3-phosphatidyltransferase n=1 Tax=Streptomonospora nanhaiensis TaxID=1323731 RepID=A0A853BJ54_9ACTN|nr:CDP-diacylglycerol--glycerol-3-phosphate 3-phosphatidyltransferase [Streptomonospora nanhaiensis]MBV2363118.1 CDP-diacylglycerol--glycerol-3-phosphate 3-phosphatidyltransferase [Streptomonospora nanhaiensis]MBX9390380.1 CDP-diacylglycerol--glycerol-3-phosphate 3-phosphatidyltransferase [Streptomonospora nanhaiensis]NYI95489.1 CDP-diacylglycerol--glycerol-3-phosphate 3-phosphatidyltransferase [Streptomonospora nanhaiensis]